MVQSGLNQICAQLNWTFGVTLHQIKLLLHSLWNCVELMKCTPVNSPYFTRSTGFPFQNEIQKKKILLIRIRIIFRFEYRMQYILTILWLVLSFKKISAQLGVRTSCCWYRLMHVAQQFALFDAKNKRTRNEEFNFNSVNWCIKDAK